MANCISNVYGGTRLKETYAKEIYEKAKSLPEFHQVHQNKIPSPFRERGQLVTHTIDSVKTKLNLSFIYLSTFGSRFPFIGNKIAMRKQASIVREYQAYERESKKK